MKMKFRRILALVMAVALVVTTITFTAGNTLKAEGEDAATSAPVASEPAAPAPEPEKSEPAAEKQEIAVEDNSSNSSDAAGTEAEAADQEEVAEVEEDVPMPAQSFNQTASNGIRVVVSAPEGAFPEGTAMKVVSVSHARAISLVEGAAEDVVDANGVDITFYKGGKEIQPKKAIKVSLSNADVEGESFNVYHVADNGSVNRVAGASSDGASFRASSFSIYIVGGSGDEETPYTATYTFKNGDEVVDTQIVKDGETLNKPKAPEKEGYKFVGWYDGDKEFTDFGTQTVSKTSEVTLNAKFQEAHYVFFKHPEGGIYTTKEGVTGNTVSTSDVVIIISASSSAYKWYKDEACTEPVSDVTLGDKNIYLYTKIETGHWLAFDSNGGSFVSSEFVNAGKTTAKPADPTRLGYNFAGWKLKGANFNFGQELNEDTTVQASWTAKNDTKYTVIHWQENADDDGYSFKESETKTGTTGANTAAATKSYNGFTAQAITQKTIAGDGTTIVNVYYKRNVYTLTFQENKGSAWWPNWDTVATIKAKYGAKIADKFNEAPFTTTYKGRAWEATSLYNYALQTLDVMPMANVTFHLYKKSSNELKTIYYYGEALPGGHVDKTYDGKGYTLIKSVDTYFNYMTYNEEYHEIEGYTRWSASKAGFKDNEKKFTNNKGELYYDRNSYNIVFMNNGTKDKTVSKKYEASIADANYDPKRPSNVPEAYTFGGWYDNQLCEGTAYSFNGKTMPANNVTLYAKWSAPEVQVVIHVTVAGTTESHTISYGEKINPNWIKTPTDIPAGSTFIGWGTKEADGLLQLFDTKQPIYSDIELYPICSDYSKTYNVSYYANGGSGRVTDSDKYHENSRAEIKSARNLTAPDGKVFNGWNTKDDGSGKMYQPGDKISIGNANVVLYAQWGDKVAGTSIVYHSNYPDEGSDEGTKKQELKNNEKINVMTPDSCGFTAPAGYEFEGWSDTPGGDVKYKAGQKVLVDNLTDNNLYAKWKCVEVTVKITGNTKTETYDGTPKTVTGFTTDIGAKDITIRLREGHEAKATGKNVGEYPMNLTPEDFVATSNTYGKINIVVVADGKLTITPADKLVIKVTGKSESKVYTGSEQSISGYTIGSYDKDDVKITKQPKQEACVAKGTEVGKYPTSGIAATDFEATSKNYSKVTFEIVPGELEITPITEEYVITITGETATKVYNGEEQSVTGYSVSDYDKTITLSEPGQDNAVAKGTNARDEAYPMGLEGEFNAESPNYTNIVVKVKDGWLKIDPKSINPDDPTTGIKVDDPEDIIYDGKAHKWDPEVKDTKTDKVLGQDDYTVTFNEGADFINKTAGDEAITATITGKGNYTGEFTRTYKILPRPITVTTPSATKVYDGTALTRNEFKIGGKYGLAKGEEFVGQFNAGQVEPGSRDNDFTSWGIMKSKSVDALVSVAAFEGAAYTTANYEVTFKFGTLTVTPAPTPVPDNPNNGGGGAIVAGNGLAMTTIADANTPLANGLLDAHCCILHLLIMLAAMLMLIWYTHDMKSRQRRIFELEAELEGEELE